MSTAMLEQVRTKAQMLNGRLQNDPEFKARLRENPIVGLAAAGWDELSTPDKLDPDTLDIEAASCIWTCRVTGV